MSGYEFKLYATEKPPEKGVYVWRVPHVDILDLTVVFLAEYRLRGAGHEMVLSPEFDYWDGWRLHVNELAEWAYYTGELKANYLPVLYLIHNDAVIKPTICPYCKKEPIFKYTSQWSFRPMAANKWWFECCSWAKSPEYKNPIHLNNKRTELLCPKK